MIEPGRYTSGRIAVANLSASIEGLEHRRVEGRELRGPARAVEAAVPARRPARPDRGPRPGGADRRRGRGAWRPMWRSALYIRARLAGRFHRFAEAGALLDRCASPPGTRGARSTPNAAALLQATGRYRRGAGSAPTDWRRTIPGFTRWGRSRRCWRRWTGGRRPSAPLCGRARCGCRRLAFPVRPTALRMGRERHAPRRARPGGGDLRRARPRSCRSTCRDGVIEPRWRSRAGSWMSPWRSSRRWSTSRTIPNTAPPMRRSLPPVASARRLRAKRNARRRPMSGCSPGGPKRTPTTRRPSSWASAIARSVPSSLPWPIGSFAIRHARVGCWPGRCAARNKPHDPRARRAGGRHGSRAVGPGSPGRDRALCRCGPGTELEDGVRWGLGHSAGVLGVAARIGRRLFSTPARHKRLAA